MHELVMPFALAGHEVERVKSLAVQSGARTMTAVIVAGRQLDGHVDGTERFIDRHLTPRARVARVFPGAFLPGVVAELTGTRNGVENPQTLAATDIEGANVALLVREALGHAAWQM